MGLIKNLEPTSGGCVIGRIQVGYKAASENRPRSTDYFVANSPYKSVFEAAYGNKPTQIEIMFTKDDKNIDEVLQLTHKYKPGIVYESREANFLSIPSKENVRFFVNPKGNISAVSDKFMYVWFNNEWQQFAIPNISGWPELNCKHALILRFRIPKIAQFCDGLWEYRTTAVSSREPIKATLMEAQTQYWQWIDRITFDMNVATSKGKAMDKLYPVVNIAMNINKAKQLQAETFRPIANAATLIGAASEQLQLTTSQPVLQTEEIIDYEDELNATINAGR